MKHSLDRIKNKPSDYKLCAQPIEETDDLCGAVNWYENKGCVLCGESDMFLTEPPKEFIVGQLENFSTGFEDPDDWEHIFMEVG